MNAALTHTEKTTVQWNEKISWLPEDGLDEWATASIQALRWDCGWRKTTLYKVERQALTMAENSDRNSAQLKKMQGLDPFLSRIQRDTLERHQGWFLTSPLCLALTKKAIQTVNSTGRLSVIPLLLAYDISLLFLCVSALFAGLLSAPCTRPSENLAHDALPAKCQPLHSSQELNLSPCI